MSTKYDIDNNKRYAPTGYEGVTNTDYIIPSCGVEDLDFAVFNLFDKQIPLFYDLHGELKKVPVIFATGERFALLRRKKPTLVVTRMKSGSKRDYNIHEFLVAGVGFEPTTFRL